VLPQQIAVKGCLKCNSVAIDLVLSLAVAITAASVVVVVVMVADFVVYSMSV